MSFFSLKSNINAKLKYTKKFLAINNFHNITRKCLSSNISPLNKNEEVRVRFAPSPTGKLHIGGLRTALYNYIFAHKHRGTFILRIEDTDQERFKQGSVEFLLESLKWANIQPDYGPHLKKDDDLIQGAPWQQSKRLNLYKEYAEKLLESKKAYRCFCDESRLELLRREASKRQEKISYDGKCSHSSQETIEKYLAEGRKSVIRFKLDDRDIIFNDMTVGLHSSNPGKNEGDFIILKTDGFPTYHFAHVIDDHLMRVSHVLRGQEWLLSTPKHIAIFEAFGWKQPKYGHLPLICNPDGSKISKRQNDIDVLSYRDRGYFPETLLLYLSSIGGGFKTNLQENESFFNNSENNTESILAKLAESFDESRISVRSVKLNQDLLDRLNRRFLKLKLSSKNEVAILVKKLRLLLLENKTNLSKKYIDDKYLIAVLNWSTERFFTLTHLVNDSSFEFLWSDMSNLKNNNIDEESRGNMLMLIERIENYFLSDNSSDLIFTDKSVFKKELSLIIKSLKEDKRNAKKINYWQMIRLVLTGSVDGPPVFEIFNLMEKENIIYRLNIARKTLLLKH